MIKKIVILLGILFILFAIIMFYIQKQNQTVECWWGIMYPSLSFIAIEDEEQVSVRYSSLDNHFIQIKEPEIEYDFLLLKWFKEKFSF